MKTLSLSPSGAQCGRSGFIAFLILFSSFLSALVQAQAPPPAPPAPSEQNPPPQQLSAEELNGLLAPIALYPDALIALILPASTVPTDLVLAARYVASNGDPAQVANQPWDDSVKSLVRYPDVLKWMDQNLEWTTAVGEAFVGQPADVMNSIQRLPGGCGGGRQSHRYPAAAHRSGKHIYTHRACGTRCHLRPAV